MMWGVWRYHDVGYHDVGYHDVGQTQGDVCMRLQ